MSESANERRLDPLVRHIADEAAEALYRRMYALGRVDKEPFNHFEWSHHPQAFLPANVSVDFVGHTRFKQVLAEVVADVVSKHMPNAAELEQAQRERDAAVSDMAVAKRIVDELRADNQRLREALERYGEHDHECGFNSVQDGHNGSCTCGLDDLKASLTGGR